MELDELKRYIRDVPDFPKPGILFKDITPLLRNGPALQATIERLREALHDRKVDAVAGIESRGFLFAATLATKLGVGLIPLRKPNKLPYQKLTEGYSLEYGKDSLEMHSDAIRKGERIALVDDLLATGGTMSAACRLVERGKGEVVACLFVIELSFLKGRDRLPGRSVESLLIY
jgi:adenine phosphoribosyltransferase